MKPPTTTPGLEVLIGLSQEEATRKAKAANYTVRISSTDGTPCVLTRDLKLNRINLDLHDGNVVAAHIG